VAIDPKNMRVREFLLESLEEFELDDETEVCGGCDQNFPEAIDVSRAIISLLDVHDEDGFDVFAAQARALCFSTLRLVSALGERAKITPLS